MKNEGTICTSILDSAKRVISTYLYQTLNWRLDASAHYFSTQSESHDSNNVVEDGPASVIIIVLFNSFTSFTTSVILIVAMTTDARLLKHTFGSNTRLFFPQSIIFYLKDRLRHLLL